MSRSRLTFVFEGRLHVSRKSRHDLSGFWQRIRQEYLDRVALVEARRADPGRDSREELQADRAGS
jgi:hypothetical protein